jgi:hypothetical protein
LKRAVLIEFGKPMIFLGGPVAREEPRVDPESLEMVAVPRRYYVMGYDIEVRGEMFCQHLRTLRVERGIPESSDSVDIRLYDGSRCRLHLPRREDMGVALFLSCAREKNRKEFFRQLDQKNLELSGYRIVGEYENFSFPDQPSLYRWCGMDLSSELAKIFKRRKRHAKERRRQQSGH